MSRRGAPAAPGTLLESYELHKTMSEGSPLAQQVFVKSSLAPNSHTVVRAGALQEGVHEGIVKHTWKLRPVSDADRERFQLQRVPASTMFNMKMQQTDSSLVSVLFFDDWAQRCQSIARGDRVLVSGALCRSPCEDDAALDILVVTGVWCEGARICVNNERGSRDITAMTPVPAEDGHGVDDHPDSDDDGELAHMTQELRRKPARNYVQLADLVVTKQVNAWGVIVSCSAVMETRNDSKVSLRLIDPSLSSSTRTAILFGKPHALPRLSSVGCIVRFHRTEVNMYSGSPQLQLNVNKTEKTGASMIVRDDVGTIVYQVPQCTWSEEDDITFRQLRDWKLQYERHRSWLQAKYLRRIESLNFVDSSDLCVEIVHVERDRVGDKIVAYYVWDGTGQRHASMAHVMCARQFGAILRAELPDSVVLPEFSAGQWVILQNVQQVPTDGGVDLPPRLIVSVRAFIQSITPDCKDVVDILNAYRRRCAILEWIEVAHMVPEVSATLPVTRIADVLALKPGADGVPDRVKVRCHVVGVWPNDMRQFTRRAAHGAMEYALVLLLTDASATSGTVINQVLPVIVTHIAALQFFSGLPPCDLFTNNVSLEQLRARVTRMLHPRSLLEIGVRLVADGTHMRYVLVHTVMPAPK